MNLFTERSLQHLFNNADIEEVDLKDLEKVTEAYPFFAVGQTLLAKKLQAQNNPAFLAQVQKTALYYYNPFWLHYQLLNQLPAEPVITRVEENASPEPAPAIDEKALNEVEGNAAVEVADSNGKTEQTERIILTDGDDNVTPEELVYGPSTLLPDEADQHKEEEEIAPPDRDDTHSETPGMEEELVVAENTLLDDTIQPIQAGETTPVETEGTTATESDIEDTSDDDFATADDVPITTEYTLEEIEQAAELAHVTLVEVDEQTDNPVFGLPEKEVPEDVPITTVYTLEEIEQAGELAHETLVDTDETENASLFVLPVAEENSNAEDIASDSPDGESEWERENVVNDDEKVTDNTLENATTSYGNADEETDALYEQFPVAMPEETDDVRYDETTSSNSIAEAESNNAIIGDFTADNRVEENATEETVAEAHPTNGLPHVTPDEFSNEEMLKNIKSALDAPQPQTKAGKDEPLIPIDPYHTVDYFASQGIKLVLDNNPKDKLGKQLKSFTQWLRHMKKLGPEDAIDNNAPGEGEAKISQIADTSNTQREVLTEAMAEVLIKQGKKEKAIDLYKKLSLLHPDKSTFFAAQIQQLKGI